MQARRKPAPWDDLANENRLGLAKTIAALNDLKANQPVFGTYDFDVDGSGKGKRIQLYGPDQNAVLIGNFDVAPINMVPGFPYTGTWYDHFTGLPTSVNSLSNAMTLQPGEWHLYFDTPLPTPDTDGSVPILVNVGCTDPVAQNYDAAAEADNGSCFYETVLQLDMGDLAVDANGVHVAGSFQGWIPSDTPMEFGADSIYRTTVVAQVGSEVQYKFLNGNAWGTDEGVPAAVWCVQWLGRYNRAFVVPAANTSLDVHCFASCEACTPAVANGLHGRRLLRRRNRLGCRLRHLRGGRNAAFGLCRRPERRRHRGRVGHLAIARRLRDGVQLMGTSA